MNREYNSRVSSKNSERLLGKYDRGLLFLPHPVLGYILLQHYWWPCRFEWHWLSVHSLNSNMFNN